MSVNRHYGGDTEAEKIRSLFRQRNDENEDDFEDPFANAGLVKRTKMGRNVGGDVRMRPEEIMDIFKEVIPLTTNNYREADEEIAALVEYARGGDQEKRNVLRLMILASNIVLDTPPNNPGNWIKGAFYAVGIPDVKITKYVNEDIKAMHKLGLEIPQIQRNNKYHLILNEQDDISKRFSQKQGMYSDQEIKDSFMDKMDEFNNMALAAIKNGKWDEYKKNKMEVLAIKDSLAQTQTDSQIIKRN